MDESHRQAGAEINPDIFYMKQTISNACGTIGVLHAVGNNQQNASFGLSLQYLARGQGFMHYSSKCRLLWCNVLHNTIIQGGSNKPPAILREITSKPNVKARIEVSLDNYRRSLGSPECLHTLDIFRFDSGLQDKIPFLPASSQPQPAWTPLKGELSLRIHPRERQT